MKVYLFVIGLLISGINIQIVPHVTSKSKVFSLAKPITPKMHYHLNNFPAWFSNAFEHHKLGDQLELKTFLSPGYLEADFNGDGVNDITATVIEKKSKKIGLIIIYGKTNEYMIFGAGKKIGKPGFDESDNLDWIRGWEVFKHSFAYETKFDNGDIVGSIKRKLNHKAISIWSVEDGEPLAGGIITFTGKKYIWIHQGE